MKYVILLYGDENKPGYDESPKADFDEAMKGYIAFGEWCEENNVQVEHSMALRKSPHSKVFHSTGEETDGPFVELKEQLGGLYLIDAPTKELADEAARRVPNDGANELRPAATRDD